MVRLSLATSVPDSWLLVGYRDVQIVGLRALLDHELPILTSREGSTNVCTLRRRGEMIFLDMFNIYQRMRAYSIYMYVIQTLDIRYTYA